MSELFSAAAENSSDPFFPNHTSPPFLLRPQYSGQSRQRQAAIPAGGWWRLAGACNGEGRKAEKPAIARLQYHAVTDDEGSRPGQFFGLKTDGPSCYDTCRWKSLPALGSLTSEFKMIPCGTAALGCVGGRATHTAEGGCVEQLTQPRAAVPHIKARPKDQKVPLNILVAEPRWRFQESRPCHLK